LTSSGNEVKKLNKNILKSRRDVVETNKQKILGNKISEDVTTQIIALKAKHEQETARFDETIKQLMERLNQKDDMIEFDDKSFDQSYSNAKDKNKVSDYTNPIDILKLRLNKIIATNKEKKKLMDQYIRNVRVIEDAFEQIKEASGINNIQEIVTTFIKAEEQNYSLFNYVNMLNTETDALEESNKEIKEQILRIKERGDMNEMEKRNLKESLL
jgi:hypothetical protein